MDKSRSKNQTKQNLSSENIFTNKNEIEYPSIDSYVDIKTLNNNTKILNENKIDKNGLGEIKDKLYEVVKEKIAYNVEEKVVLLNERMGYTYAWINNVYIKMQEVHTWAKEMYNEITQTSTSRIKGKIDSIYKHTNIIYSKVDNVYNNIGNISNKIDSLYSSPKVVKSVQYGYYANRPEHLNMLGGVYSRDSAYSVINHTAVDMKKSFVIINGNTHGKEQVPPNPLVLKRTDTSFSVSASSASWGEPYSFQMFSWQLVEFY